MIPAEIVLMFKDFYTTKVKPKLWLIALIFILVAVGYGSVLFLGKDNKIEQDIEVVIEGETGIKIDLTP